MSKWQYIKTFHVFAIFYEIETQAHSQLHPKYVVCPRSTVAVARQQVPGPSLPRARQAGWPRGLHQGSVLLNKVKLPFNANGVKTLNPSHAQFKKLSQK